MLASVLSGEAVLPRAGSTDIYLTALGALLTAVYMFGLVFRLRLQIARMGVDSLVVLVLYLLGIAGLVATALLGFVLTRQASTEGFIVGFRVAAIVGGASAAVAAVCALLLIRSPGAKAGLTPPSGG